MGNSLDYLSKEEKQIALKILDEISNNKYDTYQELLNADYKEVPVDILTFIKDRKYLGNAWHLADGTCTLYPFWEEKLTKLFPTPYDTNYNTAIFSGARGLGKSEIAVTCALYLMYRILCLKNPHDFYNLKPTEKICFAFMNITKGLAEEIGISKFQNTVKMSPWFLNKGYVNKADLWVPPDFIEIIIGSQNSHVIGKPIIFAFFDEISFIRNQDIERQKEIAINMVDTAIGGMKTRFIKNGKNPTLMILGSSKRSEKSFLETHIRQKQETDNENTFIVDDAVWNVKPKGTYKDTYFDVAVGNKFLNSLVVRPSDNKDELKKKGYKIISVPDDFLPNFLEDIDRALCDFAGISSTEISNYISGARTMECVNEVYRNPFIKDVIEVGNAQDDLNQYYNFFDLNSVESSYLSRPLYIHMDMSISGDKTGIAGIWIVGSKINEDTGTSELVYQVAFCVSIKAPKGTQVSFEKNRQFIYWLRERGFNIKSISSDTYMSADIKQTLVSKGYDYELISVDRVSPNSRICLPYQALKNAIYENRLIIPSGCELAINEATMLERNINTGRVDHPPNGSKDAIDAICGAVWNASQHAEEYTFNYGEAFDNITSVNSKDKFDVTNINAAFEEGLKNISPYAQAIFNSPDQVVDRHQQTPTVWSGDGMIVW